MLWLAFSRDGRFLAASHENQLVSIWDVKSVPPRLISTPIKHSGSVWGLAFGSGTRFATSDSTGVIRFWNAETGLSDGRRELEIKSANSMGRHPTAAT